MDSGIRSGAMGRCGALGLASAALVSVLWLGACRHESGVGSTDPGGVGNVVTGDIQAGIERHIDEQVRHGGGFFRVTFEGRELRLKLVRVHVEYLASLGPRKHFACVDMVADDGEFYDVDFFMEGDPGAMAVTETTVHKINGRPVYVWKQLTDKSWVRAPVDGAPDELLGVRNGRDAFEFRYRATVPELSGPASMWLPLARSDAFQHVEVRSIEIPGRRRVIEDPVHGNRVLHVELGQDDAGKLLEVVYRVERVEVGAYEGDPGEARGHLSSGLTAQDADGVRTIAERTVAGIEDDLMRARALYDHVIDSMAYQRCGEGWGQGDAVRACSVRSGNCTDFHSYFIALARAIGIPARFAIGAALPSERDEGGVDGYHCWAEFYAGGKWWPVDISEANKFTALSMYYFGHHPANRFEFSRGRDLVLDPGPASGPINFLAYPVVEADGRTRTAKVDFRFTRLPPGRES
jgi:hypothetical protein